MSEKRRTGLYEAIRTAHEEVLRCAEGLPAEGSQPVLAEEEQRLLRDVDLILRDIRLTDVSGLTVLTRLLEKVEAFVVEAGSPGVDQAPGNRQISAMKTAEVTELQANLRGLLREVEQGEVVLVLEGGRPVAELRPAVPPAQTEPGDSRRQSLIDRGLLRPARAPGSRDWAAVPGLGLPAGTAEALLAAERDG